MKGRYVMGYMAALLVLLGLLGPGTVLAQDEVTCASEVIVQADDWLSKIAEKAYGEVTFYPAIATATNLKAAGDSSYATIDNPDLIEPGWKLCVPSLAEAQTLLASSAGGTAAPNPAALTVEELANATYAGIYEEPVTLSDGTYEGAPFVEGGASRPTVTFLNDWTAFGDLNGDGLADAAVLLGENSGGSGSFIYLAAVIDQAGQPVNAATTLIGDRVEIKSITIENGRIIMEFVTPGPDDPLCCPTLNVRQGYMLQGDQLVEVSPDEQGATGSAEVTATEVIVYVPANIPTETRSGSCWTHALGLGREDAYRCMVGNEIFDPCFAVGEPPTVVCGATPTTEDTAFALDLTEPLPEPEPDRSSQPWLVELADGTICRLSTGTAPVIDNQRADYACDDGWSLLGELQPGEVWQAEKALITSGDDGFVLTESMTVPLRRVWR